LCIGSLNKYYAMKKTICILIFLSGFFVLPVFSQADSTVFQNTISDTHYVNPVLFDSNELFEITLRFDITAFKKKRSDVDYLDAILTYRTSNTDSINKKIKVKARGNVRKAICDFPPLMLEFKMKDSSGGEFGGINKMKMVSYCKKGFQNYVLKEYLIYKLYNVLTDNSLRVRLLKINYINTSKPGKPVSEFGFVIEPVSLFEKRTNSIELKTQKITQKNIKPEMMDRMAIFNYMIGNTDWSVPILHNVLVFAQAKSENPELGMIVPFDFDYSGLVNAEYAVPFEGLGIKTVRDRRYIGICREKEAYISDLKEFSDRKDKFYKVINAFPYLNDKEKKDMILYLDGFFEKIDKRNTLVYDILGGCISF
jgi:hypothetical protein